MSKRTVGVITGSRAEYGLLKPLISRIYTDPNLNLQLCVTGSHLCPDQGYTINGIIEDQFPIYRKIDTLLASHSKEGTSKSIGLGIVGFADLFANDPCDILVLLGDRFEIMSAAIASLPFNIPIAHIHGGELTEGAFDDAIRHSLTMMSHLHFVSTDEYARRVTQLGVEQHRIFNVGALSCENVLNLNPLSLAELSERYNFEFKEEYLLITFHPVTKELDQTQTYVNNLLTALKKFNIQKIFTAPNNDTYGATISKEIKNYIKSNDNAHLVNNFGTEGYLSAISHATAMVGNSSSGILESLYYKVPAVDIGTRQKGRIKTQNVLETGYSVPEIFNTINTALAPEHLNKCQNIKNIYGSGDTSSKIHEIISNLKNGDSLLNKRFMNLNR
ncbi:MAG: UDP-N-acetylglucosamine 2-epimerase [Oligoflexales bacterium]